jgi:hypothetical protein
MKQCVYCGKEQPDEATSCPIDGEPLKTVIATPPPPVPTVVPLTLGSIKTLKTGLVAFGLIIWPVVLYQWVWADQAAYHERQQLEGPWAISWLAGSIVAIYGIVTEKDKESPVPRLLGWILCVGTLCFEVALVVYGLSQFSRLTSN